jgi:hypothetical protein
VTVFGAVTDTTCGVTAVTCGGSEAEEVVVVVVASPAVASPAGGVVWVGDAGSLPDGPVAEVGAGEVAVGGVELAGSGVEVTGAGVVVGAGAAPTAG